MANLFKQLEESVIRWEFKLRRDEFFVTRIRLTALYTILSVIFLVAFSYIIYGSLTSRLAESVQETIQDPFVRGAVLVKASSIIENLIFLGDSIILVIVVFIGFFLTKKTLEPIQRMVKKQERFIADASHELRTPLSVMKTSIEVSLRQKDLSNQAIRKTLSDTLDEVNILTALSNDLINISKEFYENVNLTKISPFEILEKTIRRLKMIADEKKINLSLSGDVESDKYIMGSESMISQVFYNLIYNALLYTPEGGKVEVNHSVKKEKYIVKISDTGIGISEENLKHIFHPFYRADNSRTISGSGLGLSIVKSHIDVHQGKIEIKSELGKGTTVLVELPITS